MYTQPLNKHHNEARNSNIELDTYVNVELKTKHSRTCAEISVGDNVNIYNMKKLFDKSHVSKLIDQYYKVVGISKTHGLTS